MSIKIKTGIGYDVHAFAEGRQLIIGGVNIPYEKGLLGHSDADVLCHAVSDAITGPSLGKDIGNLFPDNDMSYKDANSILLLKKAVELVAQAGYTISSVDAVIIAQAPKMAVHIPQMRQNLADTLGILLEDVTIKATTTEYLGFTGRKEGIAALSVATLTREMKK